MTNRKLTVEEFAAFEADIKALEDEVRADLGERDVRYIKNVLLASRASEALGRALLAVGIDPVTFLLGSLALGVGKILDNMEFGHNVMHGQYDWTGDPELSSQYDWNLVVPGDNWKTTHNFIHHTYCNVVGRDDDVGYNIYRLSAEQEWKPWYVHQLVTWPFVALGFEWGVGSYSSKHGFKSYVSKILRMSAIDYVAWPLVCFWNAPRVAAGNLLANLTRNVWAWTVIWCGHFSTGVELFTPEETANESKGQWYLRQALGSSNIEGSRLFHILAGNLSHQIEHHLFPDIPSGRYIEMAPKVRAILEKYGQRYNTGSLSGQVGSMLRSLYRNAFPTKRPELATV